MPTEPSSSLPLWISLGAGGHAASVAHALEGIAEIVAVAGESLRPWPVDVLASDIEAIELARRAQAQIIVTVGDNRRRLELLNHVPPELLLSAAAVTSTVAPDVTLAGGTVVMHHAHVGPGARIGRGVIVNTGAVVEHDVTLGDGVHVAPGAVVLGAVSVGSRVMIGAGARILPGLRVGAESVVGAGAIVTRDVPAGVTVVGIPASETDQPERGTT